LKVWCRAVTMYDVARNFVLQTEDGRLGHIRVPLSPTMIKESRDELLATARALFGEGVQLEGIEQDWMPVPDKAGRVEHPFDKSRLVTFEEMPLSFSNYLASDWSRWIPKDKKAELDALEAEALELQGRVQPLAKKINDILGADYSKGTNLAGRAQ